MNTLDQLRLNGIKNKLTRHQPLAPDDLQWLISKIENIDFELQRVQAKLDRLKKAVNDSQIAGIQASDAIKRAIRNGDDERQ
jgi:hypothetical protein